MYEIKNFLKINVIVLLFLYWRYNIIILLKYTFILSMNNTYEDMVKLTFLLSLVTLIKRIGSITHF